MTEWGKRMLGDYSTMDWVTLGGVVTTVGGILGVLITNSRDNKALSKEHDALSKEHSSLSQEHDRLFTTLSVVKDDLSKEHSSLKADTQYIRDEMLTEKMARESLYQNTSRAKEILETMDMMKEVVMQNARLNAEVSDLKVRNQELLVKNQELLVKQQTSDSAKLLAAIGRFENRLADFERYRESEEIRASLKKIENELSEYTNKMHK